jgi:hypothetical protein
VRRHLDGGNVPQDDVVRRLSVEGQETWSAFGFQVVLGFVMVRVRLFLGGGPGWDISVDGKPCILAGGGTDSGLCVSLVGLGMGWRAVTESWRRVVEVSREKRCKRCNC